MSVKNRSKETKPNKILKLPPFDPRSIPWTVAVKLTFVPPHPAGRHETVPCRTPLAQTFDLKGKKKTSSLHTDGLTAVAWEKQKGLLCYRIYIFHTIIFVVANLDQVESVG